MTQRSRRRTYVKAAKPVSKAGDFRAPVAAPEELTYPEYWRYLTGALIVIAVIYAFLAGFRTVHDYDLGWQMATGRWIVQHHHIPSTDVFSYTAHGKPWIYPVLSGIAFYGLFLLGGYGALTWLTAFASAATTFFLTRQEDVVTAVLAIIAVPVLVTRLTPRADLFSTVLFAAVLSILWSYYHTGRNFLWMLPILLLLWVNLHWAFVTGLGLCGAYVMLEAGEFPFAERREAAKRRLRKAWPWLFASGLATLVNPWGPKLYLEMLGWGKDLAGSGSGVIVEFAPLRITPGTLEGSLAWRNPDLSAIWWLLFIACIAVFVSLARRNWGAAVLLAGSAVACVERNRFKGFFACIVVVVAGSILFEAATVWLAPRRRKEKGRTSKVPNLVAVGLCLCFVSLAGVRMYDLVSNRHYMNSSNQSQPFRFGTGLSSWYPQRAMGFVEREHLPGNIFNSFELGGYLVWRLPEYPDFIDSRGRPFAGEVYTEEDSELSVFEPDSAGWQKSALKWGIKSMIIPIGIIDAWNDKLPEYCESQTWRPVYLDEVSAVFLRRGPDTQALIDRLQIDCKNVRFAPPAVDSSFRNGRADLFQFWLNAGDVVSRLGRWPEALDDLNAAQGLFPESHFLPLERAVVLMRANRLNEAELELRRSIQMEPAETSWQNLFRLLYSEQRYAEAAEALRKTIELSALPGPLCLTLGEIETRLRHGKAALAAFDEAEKFGNPTAAPSQFHADLADGRAKAWFGMGNAQRAIELEEQAVQLMPDDANRWKNLADLYQAVGRTTEAQEAMQRARQPLSAHPQN